MNETVKKKIITDASLAKYTRQQQQKAILNLLDDLPIEELRKNHRNLAAIYKLIAPKPPKKPRTDFGWVSVAKSKEEVRYYLREVYYNADKKEIVATDGHRLHIVRCDMGLSESTWLDGLQQPVDLAATYPDYTRIIPEITDDHVACSVAPVHELSIEPINDGKKHKVTFEGHKVNYDHWMAAVGHDSERWTCFHLPDDKGTPLLFQRDDGLATAAIMQLRG